MSIGRESRPAGKVLGALYRSGEPRLYETTVAEQQCSTAPDYASNCLAGLEKRRDPRVRD